LRNEILIELARKNPNDFNEQILNDIVNNVPITQHIIHRLWHAHIDWCKKNGVYAGMLAPFGHGKTEQVIIGRLIYELGRNPNLRIKLISNLDNNASARVMSIRKHIEDNIRVRQIFPKLIPEVRTKGHGKDKKKGSQAEKWTSHTLFVKRDIISKDFSLEAWGIMSQGTGSRGDMIFFDDPVDFQNAIAEPTSREKIKDAVRSVWLPRLDKGGMVVYIATVWHEEDLTSELMRGNRFCFLKMAISEDLKSIEAEVNADETHPLNLYLKHGVI